uniref:Uncharacterized protein n=1 Tax=Timema douglasi TaxID=61478 RepID=A0A7R8Z3J7_TIMDO|nr:unnamed protein product [Timema douglasi]
MSSSGDTVSSCSSISSYGSAEGDLGPLTVFSFVASAHPYSGSPAPPFREGLLLQSKEKGAPATSVFRESRGWSGIIMGKCWASVAGGCGDFHKPIGGVAPLW